MAEDMIKRIELLEERIAKIEQLVEMADSGQTTIKTKKMSVREFLDKAHVNTQTDMVTFIAYYKEKYEGLSSFSIHDLLDGFRNAKEKSPVNINSLVNSNISRSYFMPSPEKTGKLKRFELTNTGIKYVKEQIGEK